MTTDVRSFLVVDLEATTSDDGSLPPEQMETIEIGAVLVDATTLQPVDEFQSFVRPIRRPRLLPFVTKLTGITQAMVDDAPLFPVAFAALRRKLIDAMIDRMGEHLREAARGWIPHFRLFHAIKREYDASGQKNSEVEAYLDEVIHNLEEDMHASIEGDAVHLLAALRSEDATLLDDDKNFIHFARYIAAQQLRTPGVQRRWIATGSTIPGFNAEASVGLLRTILATNLSFSFFQDRRTLRLTFLNAPSGTEFITGDQPIINTRADRTDPDTPPTEVELYYPLTPERALLLDFKAEHARERRSLTENEVAGYNSMLAACSESQLYARSKASLPSSLN